MFQASLLKNFSKSFHAPDESKIIKLLTKEKFIAEDANGAEFIARLKKASKLQDEITKEVYKEYSHFRLQLLNNLIENNKTHSKETVFKCANTLLAGDEIKMIEQINE